MTDSEAVEVFSIVATVFDIHPERVATLQPVWESALLALDVQDAMELVRDYLAGRGPERMPTVVAFVQTVKGLHGAPEPLQELQDTPVQPLWVVMWHIARDEKLNVVLPEQEGGYRQQGYDWPPEDRTLLLGDEYDELAERAKLKPQEPLRKHWEPVYDCLVCKDDGFVDVGRTIFYQGGVKRLGEIMSAPCPECDRGKLVEHPVGGRPPWGDDGFWRGQRYEVVRSGVVEITS